MNQLARSGWGRLGWIGACVCLSVVNITLADDETSIGFTVPGEASSDGSATMLGTVTVTAIGDERSLFETPYSTEQISEQDRFERAYRTLPQTLRDIPGVLVQETSPGQGSPFIRGFTAQRNLLLIDGIRLNNSVLRSGPNQYWATIDVLGLERIEVVKGPASVLYGTDAIGGTVQVFTRNPYGYEGGTDVNGRAIFRASTAERSFQQRGEVSVTQDESFGFLAGVTGKIFNDLQTGGGTQPNVAYDEYDVDFKAEWWLNDNARLVALHQRVRQNNVPRTHSTIFAQPFMGSTVGSDFQRDLEQERELTYLQFHAEGLDGPVEEVHASLSHQRQFDMQDRVRSTFARQIEGREVETIGMFLNAISNTPIGRLTYGVEFYHDDVDSFSNTNPVQGPVADDATYDLFGAFVQNEIALSDRVMVIIGGRITYASVDANRVNDITTPIATDFIEVSDDWFAAVGNARVLYELVPEQVNIFGGVSQGFRAPNLSDLTGSLQAAGGGGGGVQEIVSPGLDPEHYINFEVGTKARTDNTAVELTAFYMIIQDQILRSPTGVVLPGPDLVLGTPDDVTEVTRTNSGDGWVYGIELGASQRLGPQFTLFGNLVFLEGKVQTFPTATSAERDEWLDRLQPFTGQVGVRWDEPEGDIWAEAVVRFADDADRLSTRDMGDTQRIPPGGTPGYAVVDLIGGGQITDDITWRAGLENVFDENYRVHGSGSNMPGISFVFGVDILLD